jgi:Fe2+ or Zn2+ uptake regulation protein
LTGARRILLKAFFAVDRPARAEEIAAGLDGALPASDLASVYRNLETLEQIGLVRHVHFGHGAGLYELTRAQRHEYALCERCRSTIAVPAHELDDVRETLEQIVGIEAARSWPTSTCSRGTTSSSPPDSTPPAWSPVAGKKLTPRLALHSADERFGENARVPDYTVNQEAVTHAKRLIDARQYVLRSRWQSVQPRAREQNAFLKTHSWDEYAVWHLGLTEGAGEETKALYAFVYGDFRRLHRMGLIACHYRAAEWRHKEIELAAHELLQYLDRQSA